jgi:uroporphyrinogen-III decarboxylase
MAANHLSIKQYYADNLYIFFCLLLSSEAMKLTVFSDIK